MIKEKVAEFVSKKIIKIRLIHSVPGRMRIAIPFISMLPEKYRKYDFFARGLVSAKKGINSVTISYITGTAVIIYDREKLNSDIIMSWLEDMWTNLIVFYVRKPDMTINDVIELYKAFTVDLKKGIY